MQQCAGVVMWHHCSSGMQVTQTLQDEHHTMQHLRALHPLGMPLVCDTVCDPLTCSYQKRPGLSAPVCIMCSSHMNT